MLKRQPIHEDRIGIELDEDIEIAALQKDALISLEDKADCAASWREYIKICSEMGAPDLAGPGVELIARHTGAEAKGFCTKLRKKNLLPEDVIQKILTEAETIGRNEAWERFARVQDGREKILR